MKSMAQGAPGALSAFQGGRIRAGHHRPYRQLHPEDNNERQAIHEHVSVPLPAQSDKSQQRIAARQVELAQQSTMLAVDLD